MRFELAVGLAIVLALAPTGGAAQTVDATGRTTYDAAFFQRFQPSNALEIVRRVPGFTLEIAQEDVRGFGQAAGNVVINGQRPSSKSDTIDVVLARIPASRVARVEIGSGTVFGAEYSGKAQVVNLILTGGGGLAGTVTGSLRRQFDGKLLPEGSVSTLVRSGNSSFNAAIGINNNQSSEEGFDRLSALPSGEQIEFRRKFNDIADPNAFASGSWDYKASQFETARFNARYAFDRFRLDQTNDVFLASGVVRDDRLNQRFHFDEWEVGGEVQRPLMGGGIKLIGLATRRDRINRELSLLRVDSEVIDGFEQQVRSQRDEAVLRGLWTRPDLGAWSVETGIEGAINRLRSKVDLFGINSSNVRTRIDLPIDDAIVTEYRAEGFANVSRSVTPKLRVDLALNYEASRLTVAGDADAERSLQFFKPRANVDWRIGDGWRVQASLARTVAQLQFEDFIGAAELANERVNGGNAELLPQRSWEALATIEKQVLGDGQIKVELGYTRTALVQDRVPTPEGFDAPGNLGDGTSKIARATFDIPVARLGIKGGRISGRLSYVGTSVRDPYTGQDRPYSGNSPFVYEVNWRQDLGSFAWGFGLEGEDASTTFRQNELDTFYPGNPYITAFAEYRPTPSTTVTLSVDNLGDIASGRGRLFFAPDRRTPAPFRIEERRRNQHIVPYLTVKHNFG
ncbi:TonB-dependent receptor domain-containing protein [Sphingomonas radiodurans]|uniref:TonB-dependent receptor domain-containing protein n=1 Tax=Sphingomonas radiodurans TaxID=2890321 RepID=UPI001E4AF2B2|nr:TonB-dependent receptor [Sphingomonas radiodurans]WBH17643.1 TonB-dependent receptor [Sphingomonas radiodurans]